MRISSLENSQFDDANAKFNPSTALYVLVLEKSRNGATAESDMPIDAAILINLAIVGDISKHPLIERLSKMYPDKHSLWLSIIDSRVA